ncbi:MAG: hypothetical protein A2Y25_06590 [Candidatus Melainabacteria bacterium GWF2_37_15]|nr:MAG: hypothetical protein A2Y25_06590 [Candidatus Melainabacteria bacterium GWF2_37_15]
MLKQVGITPAITTSQKNVAFGKGRLEVRENNIGLLQDIADVMEDRYTGKSPDGKRDGEYCFKSNQPTKDGIMLNKKNGRYYIEFRNNDGVKGKITTNNSKQDAEKRKNGLLTEGILGGIAEEASDGKIKFAPDADDEQWIIKYISQDVEKEEPSEFRKRFESGLKRLVV